jgi:hypothetical protein
VLAALTGLAVTVIAVGVLSASLGIVALPAGYAVGFAVRLAILAVVLPTRIRRIGPSPAAPG